jgi:hypothetical protein
MKGLWLQRLGRAFLTAAVIPLMIAMTHGKSDHLAVEPFPLSAVGLLDSPFKRAMELNAAYLLALEPVRFLHNSRKFAGLKPKSERYGGWEALPVAAAAII